MPTRILIAEDSLAVRTALRTLLQDAGPWEIIAVENGQDAIAKAQELKPNLVILDLVMPVMDGLRAARQISQMLPDVPLLMHTMHWSPQVEVEAQKVGVRKVVPKSDSRLLVSTIQQFLTPEPPQPPTPETAKPDIPTPDIVPPPPVLYAGTAAATDKPAAPSARENGDVPGNRQPN
jgi:CheY-like chemotaxis protein